MGILALIVSIGSCVMAKTVVHETAGSVIALIGFLLLGVAAVLTELEQLRRAMEDQFKFLAQFLRDSHK
jgi:ascorbate-specific PTS system EIIC-type component UlaA